MSLTIAIGSFLVSVLSIFLSFNNRKILLFDERYDIFKKVIEILKGIQEENYMKVEKPKDGDLIVLKSKASFLFDHNSEIDRIFEKLIEVEKFIQDPKYFDDSYPEQADWNPIHTFDGKYIDEDRRRYDCAQEIKKTGIVTYNNQYNRYQKDIQSLTNQVEEVFSKELQVTLSPIWVT